jgi:capsid assembly protease
MGPVDGVVVGARHAGREAKPNGRRRGARASSASPSGLFDYPRIASRLFNRPLLISRAKLDVVLSVLIPRLTSGTAPPPPAELIVSEPTYREFEVLEGGVAIIPVCGSLVHSAKGGPDPESGLTSYPMVRRWLDQALDDAQVAAIVLDVDSPGGEASGVFDLAAYIRAARSRKPIVAVADEMAFSAAYAIVSAAERVFAPRLAGVGSVGVIAVHVDQSRHDAAQGLKYTAVYAGERKNDFTPHEPLSREALEILQGEINAVYDVFVAEVSAGRGLDEDRVRATEAGLFFGEEAVDAGFTDEVATVDDAIEAARSMAAGRRRVTTIGPSPTAAKETPMARKKIEKKAPATTDELEDEKEKELAEGDEEEREEEDEEQMAGKQKAEVIDFESRKAELEAGTRKTLAAEWAKTEAALRTRLEAVKRLDLFADLAPIARAKGVEAAVSALFDRLAAADGAVVITSFVNPLGNGEKNPLIAAIERRNAEDADRRKAAR